MTVCQKQHFVPPRLRTGNTAAYQRLREVHSRAPAFWSAVFRGVGRMQEVRK